MTVVMSIMKKNDVVRKCCFDRGYVILNALWWYDLVVYGVIDKSEDLGGRPLEYGGEHSPNSQKIHTRFPDHPRICDC